MLIKKNNEFVLTRLDSYKRYLKVIKPLDMFLSFIDGEDFKPLTAKDFKE